MHACAYLSYHSQRSQRLRRGERHILLGHGSNFRIRQVFSLESVHQILNQMFRSRCPGGNQHGFDPFKPFGIKLGLIVDQVSGFARLIGGFNQPLRVRAVSAADHQYEIDFRRNLGNRVLAVRRRVTKVRTCRHPQFGEAILRPLGDVIVMMPPLAMGMSDLNEIVTRLTQVITNHA